MKKIAFVFIVLTAMAFKSDKPAYLLYEKGGKRADYSDLLKEASKADVVLFGELHNNPVCHWLQYELTRDLFEKKGKELMMGAEMFETDNQIILNEYLSGAIKVKNFEGEAKLWTNYKTDYKPLVTFAAEKQIPFIATNIPRRYAAIVNQNGFEGLDSLGQEAKALFMPLPVPYDSLLPGYKGMIEMMGGPGGHVTKYLPMAQAAKDATMANSIIKHWSEGKLFIHYNGTFHSDDFEGIVWYLNKYKPGLKIMTISTVEQDTISNINKENENKADFILAIPSNMTKTQP